MQLENAVKMAVFPWITWWIILTTQGKTERICLEKNRPRDFQNYGILK
jgi:hypothetical protein